MKTIMERFSKTLIIAVMLVTICIAIVGCKGTPRPVATTTDIIMIEPNGSSHYTVVIHGHTITRWYRERIITKVDPFIKEGKPKATFILKRGKPDSYSQVILAFHSVEEAKKALKSSAGFDIDVKAGRDASVAVSKSKSKSNSSCFISSIEG